MTLQPGDKAPDFTVKDQNGNEVSLKDFKGQKVALYFYPEDDTTGCTQQACNLRDNYTALKEHGITILGVSADDEKSHTKFINKYTLPFTLLADTDKKLIESYGVWGQKKMFGHEYMGILRTTFLIDEEGKIAHIIDKVKTKEHTQQILKAWGING
jgi:thioredoxin-dependent peroxiredoxin